MESLFWFSGDGHLWWCALNVCVLLTFLLVFWLSRTKEVFIIGISAYFVIFLWAVAKFFGVGRRGGHLSIDWVLFSALMEFVYLSLFIYFSRRAKRP